MVSNSGLALPVVANNASPGIRNVQVPSLLSIMGSKLKNKKVIVGLIAVVAIIAASVAVVVTKDEKVQQLESSYVNDDYSVEDYPTASPTFVTPNPTFSYTDSPTVSETGAPTISETGAPTVSETDSPTISETGAPTTGAPTTGAPTTGAPTTGKPTPYPIKNYEPTNTPTSRPTESPSVIPTASPSYWPTGSPTGSPSKTPTGSPSKTPTGSPSKTPTESPTSKPTGDPTASPSNSPSASPSEIPTASPSVTPSESPTDSPTASPSVTPTESPTDSPTGTPSESPTNRPTGDPTTTPTASPSAIPTESPTKRPTGDPTTTPTESPSAKPTDSPSATPTASPTKLPTGGPTTSPTDSPTNSPSETPTASPSKLPTGEPTESPSEEPSELPTRYPTKPPVDWPTPGVTPSPTMRTRKPTPSPTSNIIVTPLPTTSEDVDCPNFGVPSLYNGFFCGHYKNDNAGGDVNGRLAVRGDFKASVWTVVSNMAGIDRYECVAGDYGLVIGGNGEFNGGTKFSLAHAVGGSISGNSWDVPGCPGDMVGSLPVGFSFAQMCGDLVEESERLASGGYLPNSFAKNNTYYSDWTTDNTNWRRKWMQIPVNPKYEFNIINIVADLTIDDNVIHTTRFIETEEGSELKTIILNYLGESVELRGGYNYNGDTLGSGSPHLNRKILWNFPNAKYLKISSGIPGTILAPLADVDPTSSGVLRGQLFANSYISEDIVGHRPFVTLKDEPYTCGPIDTTPTNFPTPLPPTSSPTARPTRAPNAPPTLAPTGPVCPELDDLYKYNMFVCGDFENNVGGSDVEGRAAIKGNFAADAWSVGHLLSNPGTCVDDDYSIIIGGDADWTNGAKYSRAHAVGGSIVPNSPDAFASPGCADDKEGSLPDGFSFETSCNLLEVESQRISNAEWIAGFGDDHPTVHVGKSTYYQGQTEVEDGDDWVKGHLEIPLDFTKKVNIINVVGDMRIGNVIHTVNFVEAVAGSELESVIVNVENESVHFKGIMKWLGEPISNTTPNSEHLSKIMWNLHAATELYVTTGVAGSVLAPKASVVEGSNGVVRGNFFIGNYQSQDARSFVQVNLPSFYCVH